MLERAGPDRPPDHHGPGDGVANPVTHDERRDPGVDADRGVIDPITHIDCLANALADADTDAHPDAGATGKPLERRSDHRRHR